MSEHDYQNGVCDVMLDVVESDRGDLDYADYTTFEPSRFLFCRNLGFPKFQKRGIRIMVKGQRIYRGIISI